MNYQHIEETFSVTMFNQETHELFNLQLTESNYILLEWLEKQGFLHNLYFYPTAKIKEEDFTKREKRKVTEMAPPHRANIHFIEGILSKRKEVKL